MPANGILALLPVIPGAETGLRDGLNRIGNDVRGRRLAAAAGPYIAFPRSATLHFARLALVGDPDRGPGRQRLLLVTDFDGDPDAHLEEIFQLTSDPAALWGRCEQFPGAAGFPAWVRSYAVAPQAYYLAFRGRSLERIRAAIVLRRQREPPACGPANRSFSTKARRGLDTLGRFGRTVLGATRVMIRHGPLTAVLAARRINASLDRVGWIRLFNRLTLNRMPPLPHGYTSAPVAVRADCRPGAPGDEVVPAAEWVGAPHEDAVGQNQLTLVTVVRPGCLRRLRAVLAVIDLYATALATPGSLIGISTIHTVRWALADDARRLVMASNYDGTWEHYIDEFAEMILSGLDAIWENCHGYPESGARDVAALKRFLRCHQVPANVFYSATPDATVLNILDGLTEGGG